MIAKQQNKKKDLLQSIAAIAFKASIKKRLTCKSRRLANENGNPTRLSKDEFFDRIDSSRNEYSEGN